MTCSCPPAPVALPGLVVGLEPVPQGTRLWRFHAWDAITGEYPGDAFNPYEPARWNWADPCRGPRLSPFPSATKPGEHVPSIYAAIDPEHAALETIFRNVHHSPGANIRKHDLVTGSWHLSEFELLAPVSVMRLSNASLRQVVVPHRTYSLTQAELIQSEPTYYPSTRAWARALFEALPAMQGFRYTSRLADAISLVLYGERGVSIKATGSPIPLADPAVWSKVQAAADLSHIDIV